MASSRCERLAARVAAALGLPGNPVASLVCSHLFLKPLISRLAGRDYAPSLADGVLGEAMDANDLRRDYVRAKAARHAGRSCIERLVRVADDRRQLARVGRPVGCPEDRGPHRLVPYEDADVDPERHRLHRVEVLAEGRPGRLDLDVREVSRELRPRRRCWASASSNRRTRMPPESP